MKKLLVVLTTVVSLLLAGCAVETPDYKSEESVTLLEDSRFNGEFTYSYFWKGDDGIEEKNEYYSYTFNGTNNCELYCSVENYSKTLGWHIIEPYFTYYIIEIDESKTHFRLLLASYDTSSYKPNPYAEWGDWQKYEFLDGGNTLRIWQFPEKFPDFYEDYHKDK